MAGPSQSGATQLVWVGVVGKLLLVAFVLAAGLHAVRVGLSVPAAAQEQAGEARGGQPALPAEAVEAGADSSESVRGGLSGASSEGSIEKAMRSKLIAFYNIAFSSQRAENRHVGRGLTTSGWSGFVDTWIRPDLAIGFRRIQLHNPFGDDGDFPMELDQYQRAQEAGLGWLTEGFVEAWKPVIRGDYTGGESVDVLAYMGTARLEPFESLEAQGNWEAWLARAEESIRLPVEAGMSLGFDSFSLAEEGSYTHRFTEILKKRGIAFYIETWPRRSAPHWQHANIIANEIWYQSNSTRDNVFSREELTGEVIRLMAQEIVAEEGVRDLRPLRTRLIEALSAGYSVAVSPVRLKKQIRNLDSLFAAAAAQQAVLSDPVE